MKATRVIPIDLSFFFHREFDRIAVRMNIGELFLDSFMMTPKLGDLNWIIQNDLRRKGRLMIALDNERID